MRFKYLKFHELKLGSQLRTRSKFSKNAIACVGNLWVKQISYYEDELVIVSYCILTKHRTKF